MAVDVFSVPVFFIVFRETLEVSIIVAVLLAFLKQTLDGRNRDIPVYKKLVRQVWIGVAVGILITLIAAGTFIGIFYTLGKNQWEPSEYYWEGSFALLASIIITIMGAALLRVSKMQEKWRVKIAKAVEAKILTSGNKRGIFKRWCEKYAMFLLPLVTVLREGIEAVVFIAGVSFSAPATSIPLPVVMGILAGSLVGYLIYKGGASAKLQLFLIISTSLLYLVAAGLFSKAIWYFEAQQWNNNIGGEASELGEGPGSYDIRKSVWHVNFASASDGGWGILNGILGWQNSATYGSVIAYNVYWIAVIAMFLTMRFRERKGRWPLMKTKSSDTEVNSQGSLEDGHGAGGAGSGGLDDKAGAKTGDIVQKVQADTISEK